jgi:hypothetical protein
MYAGSPIAAQVQFNVPPQPSGNWPHLPAKSLAHVSGVQVHLPALPDAAPLHTCPVPVHVQSMVPPQPSSSRPPHWPL